MNIETNDKLIRRNARIAQVSMIAGLLVLVGGMVLSFRSAEQFGLSLVALLLGFALSQIGIYFGNRWGRRPRPDEILNQALKGLDGRYTLYHYTTPASHLLIGPAGVWALFPRNQRGTITYDRGRWRQRGGGLVMSYLRIFAQEGLGRPDLDIQHEVENVERYLKGLLDDDQEAPEINAALVFTNENVEIAIDEDADLPVPTLPVGKLKDYLRKFAKGKPISLDKSQKIQQLIAET
ncbi:MAG: hypothetical protein ACWGO1_08720 [Anaerolineales bacterium]